jgi:phage baseplate assembly protein W
MANLQKIYSDIDFTFTRNPVTGDVVLGYDKQAVVRAVRNLLLTNHYEKPFNSDIGSNLNNLLFEPISSLTASQLQTTIKTTIENYEPRVILKDVLVSPLPEKNAYDVSITFFLENATQATTLSLILERNR